MVLLKEEQIAKREDLLNQIQALRLPEQKRLAKNHCKLSKLLKDMGAIGTAPETPVLEVLNLTIKVENRPNRYKKAALMGRLIVSPERKGLNKLFAFYIE